MGGTQALFGCCDGAPYYRVGGIVCNERQTPNGHSRLNAARAGRKKQRLDGHAKPLFGCLVALQGFEPRTCGL
jgi:hypothetical protein